MSKLARASIGLGVAATVIAGTAGVVHEVSSSGTGCGGRPVRLTVSAAPDIAAAVGTAALRWEQTRPSVNGACIEVVVSAAAPSATANQLVASSGTPIVTGVPSPAASTGVPAPAVWIPDSTVWLNRVQTVVGQRLVAKAPPSLAYSPVVLGVPEAAVGKLHVTGGKLSAGAFAADLAAMRAGAVAKHPPAFAIGLAEPRNDAAGLAGAAAVVAADENAARVPGGSLAAIVADYRIADPVGGTAPDSAALIHAFSAPKPAGGAAAPSMTAAALSEQAILAYDGSGPAHPLSIVHMDDVLAGLDYPIAITSNLSLEVGEAATLFQSQITGPRYRQIFAAAGFRSPNGAVAPGFPAAAGPKPPAVPVTPLRLTGGTKDPVAGALSLWSAANTKSRVLVMINAASSMGQASADPGTTRLQLTQQAATRGLGLFTSDSLLGNWAFAPGIGPDDHREVVPIRELDQDGQAATIKQSLAAANPAPISGCGLYASLDAAYRSMLDRYAPGKINTIVVFTDCASRAPGGMTLAHLTSDLQGLANATQPLPVVVINVNPHPASINPALQKITAAVGGKPFTLSRPDDIVDVFLNGLVAIGAGG